jgi:putative CocE/NonD family hydrolase
MTISRRDFLARSAAVPAVATAAGPRLWAAEAGWSLPPKEKVKVLDNTWIPLKDGTRLNARMWIPESADKKPVPVVWEYHPYGRFPWEGIWGQTLAQYGIAYARVDARGGADSDGVMLDEYLEQELDDGVETIAWLARQKWCNGSVGQRGLSWGGINTLGIAAKAPPALKAIMPMGCCDIRFTDDAHYIGGGVGLTNFQWGVQFKGVMARPPNPKYHGSDWEKLWQKRLDSAPAILDKWMSHQRYDEFWQHGSIERDYGAIKCPVYIVDGWIDTYSNIVGRMLTNLKVPRKGLVGPWGHTFPNFVTPGPGLDWEWEEVRWWTQWLKGSETGIMKEPMLRAYMEEKTPWEVYPKDVPGKWIAEDVWPSPRITPKLLHLDTGRLSPSAGSTAMVTYVADKIVGMCTQEWLPFPPGGLPTDQTPDDKLSLTFDSDPLEDDLEILGYPKARIRVRANVKVAKLTVRLTEVTPDGKSWLVSYGLLNLTHREGHEHLVPLVPGQDYDVEITMFMCGHRFAKGNKIRAAVSEGLWPLVWPSPEVATFGITLGQSVIELPARQPPATEAPFPIPPIASMEPGTMGRHPNITITGPDAKTGLITIERRIPEFGGVEVLEASGLDPNAGVWRGEVKRDFKFDTGDVCTLMTTFELTSTVDQFRVKESVTAMKDGKTIFTRAADNLIKRDLM